MESPLRHTADLALIETAFWDGMACPLLDLHLARLAAGAQTLGWTVDPAAQSAFVGPTGASARLRVLMNADGINVEVGTPPDPIARWRLGIAQQRLQSDDPWLRIKSTRRPAYDAARRSIPAGLDEVILMNERDEVCDGSITTVFFDRGAGMRTPPLSSGLLPGVLRACLSVPEEVLHAADLPHVRLWVGNALRGMSPAVMA